MSRRKWLWFLGCLEICFSMGLLAAPVDLFTKDQGARPVVLLGMEARDAAPLKKIIESNLEKLTGVVFPVETAAAGQEPEGPALVLEISANDGKDVRSEDGEAFRIQTVDGQVRITASSPTGLRYGFYELMERLGARYWSFSEEDIPRVETLRVGEIDYAWKPPFRIHDIMSGEAPEPEGGFFQ